MLRVVLDYKDIGEIVQSPAEDTEYVINCEGAVLDQKIDLGIRLLEVELKHPNVSCRIRCAYKVARGQQINLATKVSHKAPNTQSDTRIRGVMADGGISRYVGTVIVEKTAHKSVSNLEDRTLVIGEGTRNHAEPVMQIETSDVSASHASTTGRVDEGQLYYLQSRGLSYDESVDLLVHAFLNRI